MDTTPGRAHVSVVDVAPDEVMADLLEGRLMPVIDAMVQAARRGDTDALRQLASDLDIATAAIHTALETPPA